ncbi:hypothetical protein DICVIV_06371 [Dictyocaulus viviparus]|uniref:Uncharacterized protein n=1 Tax=Dictyocaulus viviparus TaxID=29172 RepID=A0A0D8XSL8_DICVI|nr:hypothetical protein DICVIV_06371 [Dictyocaulus viviparus]
MVFECPVMKDDFFFVVLAKLHKLKLHKAVTCSSNSEAFDVSTETAGDREECPRKQLIVPGIIHIRNFDVTEHFVLLFKRCNVFLLAEVF